MKSLLPLASNCRLVVFLVLFCVPFTGSCQPDPLWPSVDIPVAGNSWLRKTTGPEKLDTNGLQHWKDASTVCRTWFRLNEPGIVRIWLLMQPPAGRAEIEVTIGKKSRRIPASPIQGDSMDVGDWTIKDTGYVAVDIRGVSTTDSTFGQLYGLRVQGESITERTTFVKNNKDNYYYWGRRGPSVHLNYKFDTSIRATWFYNEITVPSGNDVIGSYYMANGFSEGYFGMQVNDSSERRVLFSIWSPFSTDDPAAIPDSLKIHLLAKGKGVHTGEFGNEGSGGQSYLVYNWKAGNTYSFLTRAEPDKSSGSTTFTSWFFAPEQGDWKLIASFRRPKTVSWLKRLHSFLENFEPETGITTRKVLFGNQFVGDENGNWHEIKTAAFSVDQTGRKNYRKDFNGGVIENRFFLENCGFFNRFQVPGRMFTRLAGNQRPAVDLAKLPRD